MKVKELVVWGDNLLFTRKLYHFCKVHFADCQANFDVPLDLEPHRAAQGQQLEEVKRAMPGGPGYGNVENATEDLKVIRSILSRMTG